MGVTQRQTLGTTGLAWGLRISQSHRIQGHKYAMFFDPVIPLFGIPPKDIIAKGKIVVCAQLFIATLFMIVQKWTRPKCSVSGGGGGQNDVSVRQDVYHAAQKNSKLGKFSVK